MKCIRCGKIIPDNENICANCGFNIQKYELLNKYVNNPIDPDVPYEKKSDLIDNPILTLIFGLLSILFAFLFVGSSTIVLFYLGAFILTVFLTFYVASKPSKVKLRPLKNLGVGMAYFAMGIVIFKIAYQLLGLF